MNHLIDSLLKATPKMIDMPLHLDNEESLDSLPLTKAALTSSPCASTEVTHSPLIESRMNKFFRSASPPNLTAETFDTSHVYKLQVELAVEGARVMEWNDSQGLLVVSDTNGKTFGLRKVSALDPNHSEFLSLHSQSVRDIKFSPFDDSLVLTSSMDRTLKLTSTRTNNAVVT